MLQKESFFAFILIGLFLTACGGRGEGLSVKIDNSPANLKKGPEGNTY